MPLRVKAVEQKPVPDPKKITFQRLKTLDLTLIHRWLNTPHVARWWYDDVGPYEEVAEKYVSYIEGEQPVDPYLILHDNRPIGYIQTGRISHDEEYDRLVGTEDSAGVDLFIGEEDLLYKGLGAYILQCFLKEIVFAEEDIKVCVIGPEPENRVAIRAYEKAGFRYFKTIQVPGERQPEHLMMLTREEFLEG